MGESVAERNERLEKEAEEHYTKLTDEANKAAVDAREDEPDTAETEEEYNRRVANVPGIFGTNTAQELANRNADLAREDESSEELDREENLLTDARDTVNDEDFEPQNPEVGEADETREARMGASVDPSGQVNEDQGESVLDDSAKDNEVVENQPRKPAREVIDQIKQANTVEEVELALEDDDRVTVRDAADKRIKELSE